MWSKSELHAIDMMTLHGGSFVKALADLCSKADETNVRKLRAAFANYFYEYEVSFPSRG